MTDISELNIYIVERKKYTFNVINGAFKGYNKVSVYNADVKEFFKEHKEIDCFVSPANAFGRMSGGFDAALSDILGWDFQKKVQNYIIDKYYGEQVVCSSFFIETDISGVSLIHTPTMQYPSIIKDSMIVYYCMRSALICAMENDVKNIVIPVFGGATGGILPHIAAKRMKEAYLQIINRSGAKRNI